MHKIEKNIPIQESRNGKWIRLGLSMGIGDSVLLNNQTEACGLFYALHRRGGKIVQRKTDNGQIRCWRVK